MIIISKGKIMKNTISEDEFIFRELLFLGISGGICNTLTTKFIRIVHKKSEM